MSGFSADWLALREPADRRARDPGLARRLAEWLAEPLSARPARLIDLGCGTGSNLRGLAPLLGPAQEWTLVDNDPALLGAARRALVRWADSAEVTPDGLVLVKDEQRIGVRLVAADLSGGLADDIAPDAQVVTAAALFDLVSPAAIAELAARVAGRGAAFYTVLSFDGVQRWQPPHPADGAMLAAFIAHQRRDKGFGPASGPDASRLLAAAFAAHGYRVASAASPWRLGNGDGALVAALAEGFAQAVAETGLVAPAEIAGWRAVTRDGAVVGHDDCLALPG